MTCVKNRNARRSCAIGGGSKPIHRICSGRRRGVNRVRRPRKQQRIKRRADCDRVSFESAGNKQFITVCLRTISPSPLLYIRIRSVVLMVVKIASHIRARGFEAGSSTRKCGSNQHVYHRTIQPPAKTTKQFIEIEIGGNTQPTLESSAK